MKKEVIETLEKVVDYANEEKKMVIRKKSKMAYFSIAIAVVIVAIFLGILISRNVKQHHNEEGIIGTWNLNGNEICTFNSDGIALITDNFPKGNTGLVEGMAVYYFTYPDVIRIIQQADNSDVSVEFEVKVSDDVLVLSLMGKPYLELKE